MPVYQCPPLDGYVEHYSDFKKALDVAMEKVGVPSNVPSYFHIDEGELRYLEIAFISPGQFSQIIDYLKSVFPNAVR